MKKLILPALLFVSALLSSHTQAQVRINGNQNNTQRPAWGLPGSYAGDFYYLPELDTYYDIPQQQFVYQERGRWIQSSNLPVAYRGYDLNRGPKVAINDRNPWERGEYYRNKYGNNPNAQRRPIFNDNRRRVFDRNNRDIRNNRDVRNNRRDRGDDWDDDDDDDDWDDRRDNRRRNWDERDKWNEKREKWNQKRDRKEDKREDKRDKKRRKYDRD